MTVAHTVPRRSPSLCYSTVGTVIRLGSAQPRNCGCTVDSSTQDRCGAVVKHCCVERQQCVHCELLTDSTANSIKILSVAQNAAMATLMLLATMKPADIFM